MNPKVIKGQKLFLVDAGDKIREVVVVSIGRKYITVAEKHKTFFSDMHYKFDVDTWKEKTNYAPKHWLYLSVEDYQNKKERKQILENIRNIFDWSGKLSRIPLEKLRVIQNILEEYAK